MQAASAGGNAITRVHLRMQSGISASDMGRNVDRSVTVLSTWRIDLRLKTLACPDLLKHHSRMDTE